MFDFYLAHPETTKEDFDFYDSIMDAYDEGLQTKAVAERCNCSGATARTVKRFLNKLRAGEPLSEQDKAQSQIIAAWAVTRVRKEAVVDQGLTVDEHPVKGTWINLTPPEFREERRYHYYAGCDLHMCSLCKGAARFLAEDLPYRFCPNCGEKMEIK